MVIIIAVTHVTRILLFVFGFLFAYMALLYFSEVILIYFIFDNAGQASRTEIVLFIIMQMFTIVFDIIFAVTSSIVVCVMVLTLTGVTVCLSMYKVKQMFFTYLSRESRVYLSIKNE